MYAFTVLVLFCLFFVSFVCFVCLFCLFVFFRPGFFVILILMYAFTVLVLFLDCQADFAVDNVQRRELVNVYGV